MKKKKIWRYQTVTGGTALDFGGMTLTSIMSCSLARIRSLVYVLKSMRHIHFPAQFYSHFWVQSAKWLLLMTNEHESLHFNCHLLRDLRDGEIRQSWLHVQQVIYAIPLVWQPRNDTVASTYRWWWCFVINCFLVLILKMKQWRTGL